MRPVAGYEGRYVVARNGRIRNAKGQLMKPYPDKDGYPTMMLSNPRRLLKVHRIVLEAFVGPCPEGMEAGHMDGNPANNAVENLRWITQAENVRHRDHVHNTQARCEKSPLAKLMNADVLRIRESRLFGATVNDVAAAFGVSPMTVYKIADRTRWAHL